MRLTSCLPLVLLTSTAIAQQNKPVSAPQIRLQTIVVPSCPVGFSARQSGVPLMARAADGRSAEQKQAIDLEFHTRDARTLTNATIVVHGVNQTSLYLETGSGPEKKESRTFERELVSWQDNIAQDRLSVSGIAVLRSAEVTEMRFSDGTVWHPTAFSACRARLNGFRLVAAQ